jgi:hypothetical protein
LKSERVGPDGVVTLLNGAARVGNNYGDARPFGLVLQDLYNLLDGILHVELLNVLLKLVVLDGLKVEEVPHEKLQKFGGTILYLLLGLEVIDDSLKLSGVGFLVIDALLHINQTLDHVADEL